MKDRRLTIGYIYNNDKKVPVIRLSGKWLEETGFEFDRDRIAIRVIVKRQPGQLLIQLAEEGVAYEDQD